MMQEFDDAVRDLRAGQTSGRIKTCIQKQVSLLEAMGQRHPNVTDNTMNRICEQVDSWPHVRLKESMKNLYRFASDYPGIRHGGTPGSQLRAIDMRDLVAVTILLAGFSPYLSDQINSDRIYLGS